MDEAPVKRKRGNDAAGDAGCRRASDDDWDRLSSLPDGVLLQIMSRMKARQVVQTCVLARRWRNLWRSMTCLDVDQLDEFSTAGGERSRFLDKGFWDREGWEKFEDFMDMLLSPGNVSIALLDTLRLRTSSVMAGHRGSYRWIRRGIKYHHAHEPAGIQRGRLISHGSWRIRKLHFCNLYLCNLFAEHVRSRCPSLEDLELKSCCCEFQVIASKSLKQLALRDCRLVGLSEIATPILKNLFIEDGSNTKNCRLAIKAPALASMFLGMTCYNFDGGLSLSEMPSLARTRVRLWDNKIVDLLKILGSSVTNMITNLEVSSVSQTLVLDEGSTTLMQFSNLRTLVLDKCDLSDDFQMLGHFLRSSPSLERLTLRCCKYSNDNKKKKGSAKSKNAESTSCPNLVDVPHKNLKLTRIIYHDEDIRPLVELLLRISENLPNNCIKLIKVGEC